MPGEIQLRLYRDALSTPWGFRLHGGKDLGTPLTINRVSLGTPSDGELQTGDVILEMQGCDASKMTHIQAQEQIRKAGGSLLVRILRYGAPKLASSIHSGHVAPVAPPAPWKRPTSPEYGVDYNRNKYQPEIHLPVAQTSNQPGFMLGRVQNTLSGVSSSSWGQQYQSSYSDTAPLHHDLRSIQSPSTYLQTQIIHHNDPEEPAWAGSLRSSTRALPSDTHIGPQPMQPHSPKVQRIHYASSGDAPSAPQFRPNYTLAEDTAHAEHLQYNSPLGLYSKANAQEALQTQLHGKPGEGSLQIISESDVQQLVLREDSQSKGGKSVHHHHHHHHLSTPSEADIHVRQSPSLLLFESKHAESEIGQSDF